MKEIIEDIEILVNFAAEHFTENPEADRASSRVASFLATYKLDEDHGE